MGLFYLLALYCLIRSASSSRPAVLGHRRGGVLRAGNGLQRGHGLRAADAAALRPDLHHRLVPRDAAAAMAFFMSGWLATWLLLWRSVRRGGRRACRLGRVQPGERHAAPVRAEPTGRDSPLPRAGIPADRPLPGLQLAGGGEAGGYPARRDRDRGPPRGHGRGARVAARHTDGGQADVGIRRRVVLPDPRADLELHADQGPGVRAPDVSAAGGDRGGGGRRNLPGRRTAGAPPGRDRSGARALGRVADAGAGDLRRRHARRADLAAATRSTSPASRSGRTRSTSEGTTRARGTISPMR